MLLQIQNVPKSVVKGASASSSAVLEDVIKVVAGDDFAAVLKRNGDIFVWGDNTVGQLGNVSDGTQKNVPVQVWNGEYVSGNDTFIHNAVDLDIGGNSAAAIIQETKTVKDEDGNVSNELANVIYTWGSNNNGQLGASKSESFANAPVKVDLDNVRSIAIGNEHMLALTKNDEMYAWGSNSNGQLGVGDITTSSSPIPVEVKNGETLAHEQFGEVYLLGAGKDFSMAVKSSGKVYAWGSNNSGHIGDYSKGNKVYPTQVGEKESNSLSVKKQFLKDMTVLLILQPIKTYFRQN